MGKQPRSFSVDEDVDDILSERDDINASAVVNQFLREYLTNGAGRGKEAALEVRLSQLDEEIADMKKDLERKQRERDRIEQQLESSRSKLYDVVEDVVGRIENGGFYGDLSPENEAVQKWASEAGVPAEQFVEEVETRL